jgi:hypothetical protein
MEDRHWGGQGWNSEEVGDAEADKVVTKFN